MSEHGGSDRAGVQIDAVITTGGVPYVQLSYRMPPDPAQGDDMFSGVMTPQAARRHALSVLEAADAAETESIIFSGLKSMGTPDRDIGGWLGRFRSIRNERRAIGLMDKGVEK